MLHDRGVGGRRAHVGRRALRRFDARPGRRHFADNTPEAWRIASSQAGLILASIANHVNQSFT